MTKDLARNSRNSGIDPLLGWDPFSTLFSRRPMERLFGGFGGFPFTGLSDALESDFNVRIVDEDNLRKFQYALPGISKDNLHVEIVDNVLTVRVQERNEHGERSYYSKVTLGPDLDLDNVTADSKDGLLVVSVPVKTKSSRHVPINVGGGREALESGEVKVSQPDEIRSGEGSEASGETEGDNAEEKTKD